jgi:hypothetical protein
MLGKLAFLPIEVLFVTLIIHQLLNEREKRIRLEKLNMVIGAFFSEIGTKLVRYFSNFDPSLDDIRRELIVTGEWSDEKFNKVSDNLKSYEYKLNVEESTLEDLRVFLNERKDFLLRLLENPSLLEHESFTQLLQAVFHLEEELIIRESLKHLPESDYEHLSGDMQRVYVMLVHQWLDYMRYLKDNYPYIFSLAMRTNPFDKNATPIVS